MNHIQEVAVSAVGAVRGSRRSTNSSAQRHTYLNLLTRLISMDKWDMVDELNEAEEDFHNMILAQESDKDVVEIIVSRYEQAVDALVNAIIDEWEVK